MQREVLDVASIDTGNGGEVRVRNVIEHCLKHDVLFNSNWEAMRIATRIADAITRSPILIDDGDWEKLCAALRNPNMIGGAPPYPVLPSYVCKSIVDQVLDAKQAE